MLLEDLEPQSAVLLDIATSGAFFVLLGEMLDEGLDPQVVLLRRPPNYLVVVLGLAKGTEEIVVEREIEIAWKQIDERVRLGVLEMWVSQLCEQSRKRIRRLNIRLAALGVRQIS